jgi:nitrous oxidase accessory protein NosD
MKTPRSAQAAARSVRSAKARKPLTLALAALVLSAVALPASADWWTTKPLLVVGKTTVNVRDKGALGDGVHNDTAAIQAAIDSLPSTGGTVYVPAGRYMVDALKSIKMRSHMRLLMDPTAELDAIPNSAGRYYVVKVWNVTDVRIVGGNIVGERVKHVGTTGEWGYGINIQGSTNVLVKGVHLSDFWGDGMWIGATGWGSSLVRSDNVTVYDVVSTNNRRQGLSIGPAQHVYVANSTFSNSNGTLPEAGIDIEPQDQGPANTIRIENTTMSGNRGNGLEMHANISDITLVNSTMIDNRGFGVLAISAPYLTITGNTATRNGLAGAGMSGTTHDALLSGNSLRFNSTRYISPTRLGGGVERDLQIGTKTYAITLTDNTLTQ